MSLVKRLGTRFSVDAAKQNGTSRRPGLSSKTYTMNDCNQDQTDDDAPLRDDVSDDAIEAAAVARGGFPTLLYGTYCFGCPSGPTIRSQAVDA
jgi:hypothetical protein